MKYSVLDLMAARLGAEDEVADAIRNTMAAARVAETHAYERYWLAEHHSTPGYACSACVPIISKMLASTTSRMRFGAGGVLLNHHSPLRVVEEYATIVKLFGSRVDIALGRNPGGSLTTAKALGGYLQNQERYEDRVKELLAYMVSDHKASRAIPGVTMRDKLPTFMLCTSATSAGIAARNGLPAAFSFQFDPKNSTMALELYRRDFNPQKPGDKPYVIFCTHAVVAESDALAKLHFTSIQRKYLDFYASSIEPGVDPFKLPLDHFLRTHRLVQPAIDDLKKDKYWTEARQAGIDAQFAAVLVGSKQTVTARLKELYDQYQFDELMITCDIHDQEVRLNTLREIGSIARTM